MPDRPYTLISCCVSLDGYLDDAGPERLVLSSAADLDRVDAERAGCDAILVGAETVRRDDPRLLVRSDECRAARLARGQSLTPLRVTVTRSGDLDPAALVHLSRRAGYSIDDLDALLNSRSGLKGLAGHSDMRDILAGRDAGDAAATLAFDV